MKQMVLGKQGNGHSSDRLQNAHEIWMLAAEKLRKCEGLDGWWLAV